MMIKLLKKIKSQKGFTLIELLVVVAILGILAAIAVPRVIASQDSVRGTKIVADLRTIDSAISMSLADSITPDAANLVTNHYLAAFPVPPVGAVRFPNGTTATAAPATTYTVTTINGNPRGAINGITVEGYTTPPAAAAAPAS